MTKPPSDAIALLQAAGFGWPADARLVIGSLGARLVGFLVRFWDAPPAAVTLGRTVFVPDAAYFARLGPVEQAALLAHEAVHIRQWQQMGAWGFLRRYWREYLRTRREGIATHDPLRGIDLEREAIAVEDRVRLALVALLGQPPTLPAG